MNIEDTKAYIDEYTDENGKMDINHARQLLIWAYDKGSVEGIEDYREEQDPTEHQTWKNSR